MPLHIYTSNRMEQLVQALAGLLRRPLSSVFTPELIVVQSKGMQRWLAMELADRFGVWANCSYPFPNALSRELMSRVLPDQQADDCFSTDVLQWKLFGLLDHFTEHPDFALLHQYLQADQDHMKRFQLAGRLADIFDQYTLYRPDLLHSWESGTGRNPEEEWQAQLWRALVATTSGHHRGRLQHLFCEQVTAASPLNLPERITLFGISYLPLYHLEMISQASKQTDLHLFLLSPTREYWADILHSSKRARLPAHEQAVRIEGNPLLASLGRLGRDFSELTIELSGCSQSETDLYHTPEQDNLLGMLQADILLLQGAEADQQRLTISEHDRSIQIHSCHSRMREVEVLHDQLLAIIEQNPDIEPRQILVMTPDIESYTPYITAVFGTVRDPALRLPFSIADRTLSAEGELSALIKQLLELPGSRFCVTGLLDLLGMPPVQRSLALSDDDLGVIRTWLEQTRIRWGRDEHDRQIHGLPAYRANSWAAGLDRLLVGYAMADDGTALFRGIVPFDDLEGQQAVLLGTLIDFLKTLGEVVDLLDSPCSLSEWAVRLRRMLTALVTADVVDSHELTLVSTVFDRLPELQQLSGHTDAIPFPLVKSWLNSRLDHEQKGLGFMTGAVTFCAMLPMRSIPFKVIALLGMNDGEFPRRNRADGFDLISRYPRRGDRSLRDEDRYLFLETLLSVRHTLYISYIGQSLKDNSELPPSVLVNELLDALNRRFVTTVGKPVEEQLIVRHRLQAFSPRYFTGHQPLFSYSRENLSAARQQADRQPSSRQFLTTPLPEPSDDWRIIPLNRLLHFFSNPGRFFAEHRLGIRLPYLYEALTDTEPFDTNHLDNYQLKDQMVRHLLQGQSDDQLLQRIRSLGVLPPAAHGDLMFQKLHEQVVPFSTAVSDLLNSSTELPPLEIQLQLNNFQIRGTLNSIRSTGLLRYRCAGFNPKDQIKAWIEHLLLACCAPSTYPHRTTLLMATETISFRHPEEAENILCSLLEWYWQGLCAPLPFFPRTSAAYADKLAWSRGKAETVWAPEFNAGQSDSNDPYSLLCFGSELPYDAGFEKVSRSIMEPLMNHREQL